MSSLILEDFPVINLSNDSHTTLYELSNNKRIVIGLNILLT